MIHKNCMLSYDRVLSMYVLMLQEKRTLSLIFQVTSNNGTQSTLIQCFTNEIAHAITMKSTNDFTL